MSEANHYGEPWRLIDHVAHVPITHSILNRDLRQIYDSSHERIVACVNACAGMSDPSAELAKLRAGVERMRSWEGFSTTAIVREYAAAHIDAKGNPSLQDGVLCNQRMLRVRMIERVIVDVADRDDAPSELRDFVAAHADQGCSSCWLSATRNKNHPECQSKIDRYFATRGRLADLGKRLLGSTAALGEQGQAQGR